MESRKMVLKNLFTGQQWRNRHREQTYGHGERGGEGEMWKILKEMEIPDYLTCLLRNLYAGQEAT